jgi:hypothetical protein
MNIEYITFTGADESVKPDAIFRVAEEFPHIKTEWGLLLSKSNEGKLPRYPSLEWMQDFVALAAVLPVTIAGHVQGHWLRTMCQGNFALPTDRPTLWAYLQRIQLNFHGVTTTVEPGFYTELSEPHQQFIFQMDGVNEHLYHEAIKQKLNIVPLFDLSAGEGIIPTVWRSPIHPKLNGYAGGLGPDTIKEQLKLLTDVVGETPIWLDMETRVRSNNDKQFDLDKCRKVLDIICSK